MSIPSDFDPLAWGERRYIQPIIVGKYHPDWGYVNYGITDESYPYTFKMEVLGTTGGGGGVPNAFDTIMTNYWGAWEVGEFFTIMTFEHPLRIVGMQMLLW